MKTSPLVLPILLLTALGSGGYYLWLPRATVDIEKLEELVEKLTPLYDQLKVQAGGRDLPAAFEFQVQSVAAINRVLEEHRGDCQQTTAGLQATLARSQAEARQMGQQAGLAMSQLLAGGEAGARRVVAGFLTRFYPELKRLLPLLGEFGDHCPEAAGMIQQVISGASR